MAVSCDPNDLAEASKCLCFHDKNQQFAIEAYLLMQIAGLSLTAEQLVAAATPFLGIQDKKMQEAVRLYLLCQAATAAGA